MRYLLQLAYKGTRYHGWQKQPNVLTVQQELDEKLSLLTGEQVETTGCGRTDTGVHAKQFFAHIDLQKAIDPGKVVKQLNALLSKDIAVYEVREVSSDFHARFDADYRIYEYWIIRRPDPFLTEHAWYVHGPLDVEQMNEAAQLLLIHDDFECFSKVHTDVNNFFCTITRAEWTFENDRLVFTIRANRFLRNMVRAIVGTLIEVGRGKLSAADFRMILESKDRSEAGQSVPAHGLYLTGVHYPDL